MSEYSIGDVKRPFYSDARETIRDALVTYRALRQSHPPYGLVGFRGETIQSLDEHRPFFQLEVGMVNAAQLAFDATEFTDRICPYSDGLRNLGASTLRSPLELTEGRRRQIEATIPGARFAPSTIINFIRAVPRIAGTLSSDIDPAELAKNSGPSLLREPLRHPQQWARAFAFCLADGNGGDFPSMDRDTFLPDDLIAEFLAVGESRTGEKRIEWAKSTEDLVLRTDVLVTDRHAGPELEPGPHKTMYPAGTRLGDIAYNEENLHCPGSTMAYAMWDQAVEVTVAEDLWTKDRSV